MDLAGAGEAADNSAKAAAVNEFDFPQVQNDGAAVTQKPGYMREQRLTCLSGNNPSVAAHDGDASDFASIKRKWQCASGCRRGKL
jgi:hypothetical protein